MNRIFIVAIAVTLCWCTISDAQFRSRYSRSSYGSKDEDKNEKSDAQSRYERYKKTGGKSESKTEGKNYRFLSPHERLPDGVPEWFLEKDTDFDGQVKMAEFSSNWSESIVAEYTKYDKNFDGFITPAECLAAKNEGIVYNGSGGSSASSSRVASKTGSSTSRYGSSRYGSSKSPFQKPKTETPKTGDSPKEEPKVATSTAEPPKTETPKTETPKAEPEDDGAPSKAYLSYALKVIAKYDKNGDNTLVEKEWSAMSKDPAAADTSGDGKITPTEYARFLMPKK